MSCNTSGPKIGDNQGLGDYWWKRWITVKTLLHDREDKLRVILSYKHAADRMHPITQTKQEWKCSRCEIEYRESDILVLWDTIMKEYIEEEE